MIIPIKTKPSKTLSRVEKRFFFFLDREAFSLGCLLGAGGHDNITVALIEVESEEG